MTREKAIRYLEQLKNGTRIVEYRRALSMAISALLEQEERRWIPVTERMPKKSCEVIVGFVNDDGQFYSVYSVSYSKKHNAFNSHDYVSDCEAAKTAIHPDFWKPMPAPIRSVLRKEPPKEESE